MKIPRLVVCLCALGLVFPLTAGEIRGVVEVTRTLTRRVAAPSLDTYARGAAVPLPAAGGGDPLAYERTHTVIYLEGELPQMAPIGKQMQQLNRTFGPDLVVIPAGSSVSFPNMDPIFHNVFSLSKVKSFDLGNYGKGQSRTVEFPKPGIVLVNCRLHTNMSGVIVVAPNAFYALPDANGRFAIPNVPPGKYTVTAWHKVAGFIHKEIAVSGGEPVNVDFLVPLGDASIRQSTPPQR